MRTNDVILADKAEFIIATAVSPLANSSHCAQLT
jgi:hypothetical protein